MAATMMDFAKVLATSPKEGFPSAAASLEVPEGLQLLMVAPLLLAFAAAISDGEQQQQQPEEAAKEKKSPQIELVRPHAIAVRLAVAAGIVGLLKYLPSFTSPSGGFPIAQATHDTPEGVQLFIISSLLFVFVAAIKSADQDATQETATTKESSRVELVRFPSIALRLAIATGIAGLCKTIDVTSLVSIAKMLPASSKSGFPPAGVVCEVPAGVQLLLLAPLLLAFAAATWPTDSSPEESKSEGKSKSPVELVRPHAIAFRLAVAAGLMGLHLAPSPQGGFPPATSTIEMSEGVQLMFISVLLLVFVRAIMSSDMEEQASAKNEEKKSQVTLVEPARTALRLAVGAAVAGLFKMFGADGAMPDITVVPELSEELTIKCGLLLVGTVLVGSTYCKKEHEKKV